MLPLISSFTAASSGPHGSLSNATADMIWPEVQYPHWYPSQATNAACIGSNASGVPRPSMVVISSPSCIKARLRHETTRLGDVVGAVLTCQPRHRAAVEPNAIEVS